MGAQVVRSTKCGIYSEKDLSWWNHNYFGNVRKDLEAKKRQLLSVKEEAMVSGNNSLVRNLKAKR